MPQLSLLPARLAEVTALLEHGDSFTTREKETKRKEDFSQQIYLQELMAWETTGQKKKKTIVLSFFFHKCMFWAL